MTFRVIQADCIEAMAEMGENSVDAIVTDPPYGLEFMGKDWDSPQHWDRHEGLPRTGPDRNGMWNTLGEKRPRYGTDPQAMQAFHLAWATAALRILKPGGHLLSFGGTRTYHRLTCALEDAGFEIRDCLAWLYGSGFPKSLDVSKAIDKQRDDYEDVCRVALWLRPHVERVGFDVVTEAFGFADETMARARWTSRSQPQVPSWEQWERLRELCGFSDEMDAEVWRLNGRKGTPGEAWDQRPITQEETRPLVSGEVIGFDQRGSSERERRDIPHLPDAQRWQGWGTALKPAFEPIVLARKPLSERSVAANVQRWGTGALNIDGCRIGTDGGGGNRLGSHFDRLGDTEPLVSHGEDQTLGRWPPNVILDEEAAGMLDEQTGERPSAGRYLDPVAARVGREAKNPSGVSLPALPRDNNYANDTGGASRFFYVVPKEGTDAQDPMADPDADARPDGDAEVGPGPQPLSVRSDRGGAPDAEAPGNGELEAGLRFRYIPKADREERNRGLEGMPAVVRNTLSDYQRPSEGRSVPKATGGPTQNVHPTVKPVELMQWLVRMVTPPGGTVLDPFTGSGTTGMAACREGFDFIGIEREPEYVEIARARIVGDAPLFNVEAV